jgi:protein-disulfide isomerase-like protein with CxxC motif
MCVSSGLKTLNNTAAAALSSAQSEAKTVFGAASQVFNNIISSVQQVVAGGPSQAGFSTAELNAKNAQAVQEGATLARNAGGAAASSAAAIGGGNTVMPAGGTEQAVLAAKIAAGEQTAGAENTIQQQNYAQGNANYEAAVGQEMQAPNVFNPATSSEGQVTNATNANLATQKAVDTSANWWQPMVTAAIGGASGVLTGGLTTAIGAAGSGLSAADTSTYGAAPWEGNGPSYGGGPAVAAPNPTGVYGGSGPNPNPAMPVGI